MYNQRDQRRETETGQQVAQLHDRYMMMMMMTKELNNYMCHGGPFFSPVQT